MENQAKNQNRNSQQALVHHHLEDCWQIFCPQTERVGNVAKDWKEINQNGHRQEGLHVDLIDSPDEIYNCKKQGIGRTIAEFMGIGNQEDDKEDRLNWTNLMVDNRKDIFLVFNCFDKERNNDAQENKEGSNAKADIIWSDDIA